MRKSSRGLVVLGMVWLLVGVGCAPDAVGVLSTLSDPDRTFDGIPSGAFAAVAGDELIRRPTLEERALLADVTMALRASGYEAVNSEQWSDSSILLFCAETVRDVEYDTYRTIPTTFQSYSSRRSGKGHGTYSTTTYGEEVIPVTKRFVEVTLTLRAVERAAYEARPEDLPLDVLTFWSGTAVVESSAYSGRRPEILLWLLSRWGETGTEPLFPPTNADS